MQAPETSSPSVAVPPTVQSDAKTARILARTIFKDMMRYGVSHQKILEVATELISLVNTQLREDSDNGRA
jgi:hypothetical protein